MDQEKYAIVDIGSNTIRLVIYTRDKSGRLAETENVKTVARLRNYLSASGKMRSEGIDVLIHTLQSFQEVTRHHNLKEVKCVATAAVRQATNQEEILEKVKEKTDFSIRILSEYEEAHYGYLAVVNSMSFENGLSVDIGGGSTELTFFQNRKLIYFYSFPFGALSLKEQFIKSNTPTSAELKTLRSFLKAQFQTLPWIQNKKLPLIGIGGSARNMAQIHQEYIEYPLAGIHQYTMKEKDVQMVKNMLLSMNFSEVQKVEGLSKDRADIIIPAIEVFAHLMRCIGTDTFALSRKGLRDGVFYEELTKNYEDGLFPNVVEESFHDLAIDYDVNLEHAAQVSDNAVMISQEMEKFGAVALTPEDLRYIRFGSAVYNLGSYIDADASHQHTFYLLANRTIDGLLHKDRLIIALIASFKNKEVFKRNAAVYEDWFTKEEMAKYSLLGAIIKLAYSLNTTKRDIVEEIQIKLDDEELLFEVYCNSDWTPEEYQAEKQKKHLEKQLKKAIQFQFVSSS
ncbi:exopolyphosphatase [Planomicrobium sp. CPCC 101079]|uniref:exopolyphosphatase n=1 Tax=Planomicrobium sp. CPCC 101079 TaxID=2599618 RepID=UPI0011B62ED2|nr:exopolyphosphatase [Planomicrobium sp. CPCC 101079]TWT06196.1 exopolyphosphatase [Planomicrobium sp. CPCC 101079]